MKAVLIALFLISAATCAPALENGVYAFFSNQTGQVLDLWGASQNENSVLSTASFSQAAHQLFTVRGEDADHVSLVASHSKKALSVVDHKDSTVTQKTYVKAVNQQWKIVSKGNDLVAIQNRVTGKFLTVRGKAGEHVYQTNGNNQRTQLFRAVRFDKRTATPIADNGIYAFFNNGQKTVLDIQGVTKNAGAKLVAGNFNGVADQYFLIRASRSSPEHVRITIVHSGKVLTAHRNGSISQENRLHGRDSQLWSFFEAPEGCYTIENKATKQAITFGDKKTGNVGMTVHQAKNKNQEFFAMRIQ